MKNILLTIGLVTLIQMGMNAQSINTYPSNGNVGLGTSSPNTKLQVCGNVKIDSSLIVKEQLDAKADVKVDGDVYLGGDFYFLNPIDISVNMDKIAVIDANGQLRGASRASMTAELYKETCIPFTDGINNYFNAPAWQSFGGPNIDDPKLVTGINCPAKVGIGVLNPTTTFDVSGTGHFSQNVSIGTPTTSVAQVTIKTSNPSQYGLNVQMPFVQTQEYGILATVKSNNIKALAVDREDTGEDVFRVYGDGKVEAKSLRLSLNIWSDHVFAVEYSLMSLEKIAEFINTEKHLPGVPTEKEVKENGIDVGVNDAILLEKIEETYLYLIQMNTELKKLKEENILLKNEIEILKK